MTDFTRMISLTRFNTGLRVERRPLWFGFYWERRGVEVGSGVLRLRSRLGWAA